MILMWPRVVLASMVMLSSVVVGRATRQSFYTYNARTQMEHRPSANRRDIHDVLDVSSVFVLDVGELRVDLPMHDGSRVAFTTRAYNGHIPGPTIYAVPGDTFRIVLQNQLLPGDVNETSLHLHGLVRLIEHIHVTNDLTPVLPSQTTMLTYVIPWDHPSGTFWYHPHRHGLLNSQISGLMAGAVVILDRVPDLPPSLQHVPDHVLVLQGVCLTECATVHDVLASAIQGTGLHPPSSTTTFDPQVIIHNNTTLPLKGIQLLVNGESVPSLIIPLSTWVRLRFVNALANNIVELKLPCTSHLLARDGVTKSHWRQVDLLVMPPGGRADIAMQCQVASTRSVVVVDRNVKRNEWLGPLHHRAPSQVALVILTANSDKRNYQGDDVPPLEASPPHVTLPWYMTQPNDAAKDLRECDVAYAFTTDVNPSDGSIMFGVNHVSMPARDPQVTILRRNVSTVWCVGSNATHSHPFHVHNTHFQVVDSTWNSTQPHLYDLSEWRDTIPLYKDHVRLQYVNYLMVPLRP
ncbi:hypothetical protein AaE_009710 [Aphanomyces astaci]|uniref:Plastocyanin-like domain-containing protein n=1 Tax=Aphanomyces astaci TaxID=112090 RepID=A0A6A5ABM3_APHAT|nr:hypothetical protein AaE_009710 [Aphanomyces astaci]